MGSVLRQGPRRRPRTRPDRARLRRGEQARQAVGERSGVGLHGSREPSGSRARAIITYQVHAAEDAASKVSISVKFLLAGPLAQFSRSGLVKNVADHLTASFAENLEARLSGAPAAETIATLNASKYLRAAFWGRFTSFIRRLFGK